MVHRFAVAAGILRRTDGAVLIAERVGDGPFRGLWEFPGGKIRDGETPEQALARELVEELGVELRSSRHFLYLEHDYPDRSVKIDFFLIDAWRNDPVGLEGQQLRWVHSEHLPDAGLLPADVPVIDALLEL